MTEVPKILLVDDNPDNLKALEVVLRGLKAELVKVTNGNDALKATLHNDFALALLDVQMPEMDGYELANILKTEEKTENLPFIFISAVYTDHSNISKGYTRGAYNFFAKPFDPETLIRAVELFIDKYNRAKQQAALNVSLDQKAQEIQQKNNELERINKELQAFAYIASHDLKEPLRKIRTFIDLIAENEKESLSDTSRNYFKRIQSTAVRMNLLIDDLLTYSNTNSIDQIFKITDLNETVQSVKEDFKELLEEKNATLTATELPKVKAIEFQVRQVFHNLISNAIKYSSEDRRPKIKITCDSVLGIEAKDLNLSPLQTYYRISVKDNGIGFDPVYKEKVFEMFQRLHNKSEYSGTGIGLAIVKKIIDNHQGAITASSVPDKGTTFVFYLPNLPSRDYKNN
jgi:two-component system sensor histidine kinase/response regulator